MYEKKNLKNLKGKLNDKAVLVRVDLNIPIHKGKVIDATRIERILPTIRFLSENGAKVILISHFGRPEGSFVPSLSLAPIADILAEYLNNTVKFGVSCIGTEAERSVAELNPGEVLLLENLRFYEGEKKNDEGFAKALEKLADIYVNDAFSVSHRKHTSVSKIAEILPAYLGFSVLEEVVHLDNILKNPDGKIAAIVGGSKISTKIEVLLSLVEKVDAVMVGGAMANTFLAAQKYIVGKSLYEEGYTKTAEKILKKAREFNCKILLPEDVVVAQKLEEKVETEIKNIDQIESEEMILDVGVKTIEKWAEEVSACDILVWNGPLGAFETQPFDVGTITLLRYVAALTKNNNLTSIAGGGDILAATNKAGLKKSFTYISTAGGAFLEYLEGKKLPGLLV